MESDFVEENQTLENSETGEPSETSNGARLEELENTAKYMQSEKDKALADNKKLRDEIESIKSYISSSKEKSDKVELSPDDFEPWESFTDPNSKSYKYRMQETATLVKDMLSNELQGVKQEQAVSQLESDLRARGMDKEQIDKFFNFANTPVSELGIDKVVRMFNAVNETQEGENNIDTVRRTQQSPATAGVLQGQQPQRMSDEDSRWKGVMGASRVGNKIP